MGLPIAATEQYPKGLGPTVPELELEKYGVKAHPKSCFTMVLPDLMAELKEKQPETKSIILCGIETQACIQHTTLDLLEQGFEVFCNCFKHATLELVMLKQLYWQISLGIMVLEAIVKSYKCINENMCKI